MLSWGKSINHSKVPQAEGHLSSLPSSSSPLIPSEHWILRVTGFPSVDALSVAEPHSVHLLQNTEDLRVFLKNFFVLHSFYLHLLLLWCSSFLYVDLSFWPTISSFSLKNFFSHLLQGRSLGKRDGSKGCTWEGLCRRGWDTVYTWFGSQLHVWCPAFPESLGSFISYFSSLLEVSLFYFCKKNSSNSWETGR